MRKTFEFEIRRIVQEKDGERVTLRQPDDKLEPGFDPDFRLRLSEGQTAAALGMKPGTRVTVTIDVTSSPTN